MIVISGALVLVALVLLIIGVVGPDLTFVYASIAVSLVSLVFLVIGILQRRGETAPAAEASPAPAPEVEQDRSDTVTAVVPSQERAGSRKVAPDPPVAETVEEELETGGTVLVVEGRPRYHVDGCRYLSGKSAEAVDVLDARDEGFTPCGVCKPDDVLAAQQAEAEEPEALDEPYVEDGDVDEDEPYVDDAPTAEQPVVEEDVPGVQVPPPARRTAKAPAKKAAKAPAKAVKAPATRAASTSRVPSRAASAATAATPAAATAAKRAGSVVVIPDRGKFHRPECRYVRDVDGAEVLGKTAASRQGYAACGVCKP